MTKIGAPDSSNSGVRKNNTPTSASAKEAKTAMKSKPIKMTGAYGSFTIKGQGKIRFQEVVGRDGKPLLVVTGMKSGSITGSDGADNLVLKGPSQGVQIDLGEGDDKAIIASSNVTVNGGAGNDFIVSARGQTNNVITTGDGADTVFLQKSGNKVVLDKGDAVFMTAGAYGNEIVAPNSSDAPTVAVVDEFSPMRTSLKNSRESLSHKKEGEAHGNKIAYKIMDKTNWGANVVTYGVDISSAADDFRPLYSRVNNALSALKENMSNTSYVNVSLGTPVVTSNKESYILLDNMSRGEVAKTINILNSQEFMGKTYVAAANLQNGEPKDRVNVLSYSDNVTIVGASQDGQTYTSQAMQENNATWYSPFNDQVDVYTNGKLGFMSGEGTSFATPSYIADLINAKKQK